MGLKEEILALDDRKVVEVEVPEWGRTVRLMELSSADRDEWELERFHDIKKSGSTRNVRARLVGRSLVDEAGERLFTDAELDALGRKSAKAMDRLFDAAQKLNALTPEEVKDLEKN